MLELKKTCKRKQGESMTILFALLVLLITVLVTTITITSLNDLLK